MRGRSILGVREVLQQRHTVAMTFLGMALQAVDIVG